MIVAAFDHLIINQIEEGYMRAVARLIAQIACLAFAGCFLASCGGAEDSSSEKSAAQVRLVLGAEASRLSRTELEERLQKLGFEITSIVNENGDVVVYGVPDSGQIDSLWIDRLTSSTDILQVSPLSNSYDGSPSNVGSTRFVRPKALVVLPAQSGQLYEKAPLKWGIGNISQFMYVSDSPLGSCRLYQSAYISMGMISNMRVGPVADVKKHTGVYTNINGTPEPDYVMRPGAFCSWELNYFGQVSNNSYSPFVGICEPYGASHIYGPDHGINAPMVCLKKVSVCPADHIPDENGVCQDRGIHPVEIPDDTCAASGMSTPHPILPASGEKIYKRQDVVDLAPHPLNFSLTYRTQWKNLPQSAAGGMWGHNHGAFLQSDSTDPNGNTWILQKGDGAQLKFRRATATSPWVNQSHAGILVGATLSDGASVWRFTDRQTDDVWTFSAPTDGVVGRLVGMTQRNGWAYQYGYDPAGRLLQVTNQFGRSLNFTYYDSGLISSVVSPEGRSTQYEWDQNSRLVRVIYPSAESVRYVYEDSRHPQSITGVFDESGGRYQSVSYDNVGRAITSTLAGNVDRYTVSYDGVGLGFNSQAVIRDPLGTERTFNYAQANGRTAVVGGSNLPGCRGEAPVATRRQNTLGLLEQEVDLLGNVSSYGWDNSRMLPTSFVQGAGRPEARSTGIQWHSNFALPASILEPTKNTTLSYDAAGRLTSSVVKYYLAGDRNSKTQSTRFTYDSAGLLSTVTAPNGGVTRYVNNSLGLPNLITNPLGQVTRVEYDQMGRVTGVEQPDGLVRNFFYNERGWLMRHTEGAGVSALTTIYSYLPGGEVRSIAYPNGYVLTYSYDAARRVVGWSDNRGQSSTFVLDAIGNVAQESTLDGDGRVALQISRTFNSINRPETFAVGGFLRTRSVYDANGRLRQISDAAGNGSTFTLDAHARVTAITDVLNQSAGLAYNGADSIVGSSDFTQVSTGYTRDPFGNALSESSPDVGGSTNTWDSLNLLSRRVDSASRTAVYGRDKLGRLVAATYTATGLPTIKQLITYDECRIGKVCELSETHNGVARTTLRYQWDAFGRITQKTQEISSTLGTPHTSLNTNYTYVASGAGAGQIASITYPSGSVLAYGYDTTGQLRELRWNGQPLLENIAYNALGQPKGWSWAFGDSSSSTNLSATRSYTTAGQLGSTEWGSFSYNALGQVHLVTQEQWLGNSAGGFSPQTVAHAMVYDPLDRLTGLATSDAAGATLASYGYVYDANGNRVDHDMSVSAGTNRLARVGTEVVTSNATGELTEFTDSKLVMVYDAAARMSSTRYVPAGSNCANLLDCQIEVRHWYNALGQRALRDGADGQTAFVYGSEGFEVLGEYGTAGRSSEHIWLPTATGPMPVVAVIDGEHFAVHTDHLNSPRRLTDRNGVARWQWVYSGYGEASAQSLGAVVRYSLRYPGQVDDGSGLHYNWHRFYQPQTGRYTQADPIGLGGGWNRYSYVGANPLEFVDPTGLDRGWADSRMGYAYDLGRGVKNYFDRLGQFEYFKPLDAESVALAFCGSTIGRVAGKFSIANWAGYPAGLPKPQGPFRLLEGAEYDAARSAANAANSSIRREQGLVGEAVDIHEIQPVKFGGSATDPANKVVLPRDVHRQQVTPWWNQLMRDVGGQ